MSCRHDAPSTYRDLARELAQQVDDLCIQRIERNRRIAELEEALRPYLRQHDLADRDRHCVCSYCNAARAVLGHSEARLQPGPISTPRQGGRT